MPTPPPTDAAPATVLYAAADLLWATKIKSTGDAIGVACRPVRTVEMLAARLADSDVRGLIVDLDAPEVALALLAHVRGSARPASGTAIRVVAFGPHVAVELLARARREGADAVLARGAFNAQLADILRALAGGNAVACQTND